MAWVQGQCTGEYVGLVGLNGLVIGLKDGKTGIGFGLGLLGDTLDRLTNWDTGQTWDADVDGKQC